MKLANFLNIGGAYDVIKMATLHRTSGDVVLRQKDASTGPHCNTKENLLFTTSILVLRCNLYVFSFFIKYFRILDHLNNDTIHTKPIFTKNVGNKQYCL